MMLSSSLAHDVVMDVELVKDLRGDIVVVPEERKEQMLRADDIRFVELRLEIGDFQDLFGLFRQRDIADGQRPAGGPDRILDRLLQLVEVHAEIPEDLDGNPFPFPDDAEEQVLRPDVVVTEPEGLFAAQPDDILHSVEKLPSIPVLRVVKKWAGRPSA